MPVLIDLRSDTLTKPTVAMREAMTQAEVGDDVYAEDPTINRLEARAAEIFGREAAIFVPTGTMGNQIAIRLHTRPGQEVICESRAHVLDWEMGMVAEFSGCQLRPVAAPRGILTWNLIAEAIAPAIYYRAPPASSVSKTRIIWPAVLSPRFRYSKPFGTAPPPPTFPSTSTAPASSTPPPHSTFL